MTSNDKTNNFNYLFMASHMAYSVALDSSLPFVLKCIISPCKSAGAVRCSELD